mmetsp:Transcript_126106/g.288663  ORF Transcript_126106/g.288663 Transcript_126106/m.288663 type:complete len:450 (+) Transcript_126106:78-1427(+)|eukprot:CAMPEP_0204320256 /NCGR_PEP_ID=MMETSP0469-20131031/7551_1 /ASSEMBLY_ACC=CAM_ASM_000384 /TAXON_ID=2969 /ORGANISM="Oxyrrhis marina" /LENGTH=449 /DNA_ID=CAMNT_0051301519 /DNA_START=45 /DNA_END=1394 /DNA_ORIENTATION=-
MRVAVVVAVTLGAASEASISEFQLGLVEGFSAPCSVSFNRTCSDNPVAEVDVACTEGTVFVAGAASILPLEDAQARCCTARLCSGNALSTDDVVCETGSLLSGSLVAGGDPQANCCDASTPCSDHTDEVTCEGEFHADARVAAGGDPTASCCTAVGSYPCTGNTDATHDITCDTAAIPGATYAVNATEAVKTESCCTVAAVKQCTGNEDATQDVVCPAGMTVQEGEYTTGDGETECCLEDSTSTVKQCTGNEEATQDVVCPAGMTVQEGEYTTGDGETECCKEESASSVDGEVFPVTFRMHTSASCADDGTEVQLTNAEVSTPTGSASECVCLSMVTASGAGAIQLCCSATEAFVEGENLNLTRKVFDTAVCSGTAQAEDYRTGSSVRDFLSGECSDALAGVESLDIVAAQLQQSLEQSNWPACLVSELSLSSSAVAMGVSAALLVALL